MEHETGRAVLPGLAQLCGAGALVAFATGFWYLAIPCVAVVVLVVLQLRRWTHQELEERARLAEEPTEEDQAAAPAWDEDGGVAVEPRPSEEPEPDARR
ncbi:hypothetical protein [Clavibacter michiganensis]|uniref:Uncharacterized protein n=1 Tax=Clavibacter michiganensis subsp. michiganensis (strain NCPPB 382) TaxID=443906 RepID=A5CPJ4_CLAM3|nr:hypothetical protein [Clavibacter michiganensis]KAF0258377.1 hypothetical protein DOU02_08580 [Clavibacter michiganensis subsp. michiganensis]MBE3078826.1 hypothetical protein [Clavibacter michiganensis subsp. michiganensis]MBF4639258.1 hypothetical protein [Clavibacter michiganensis subsp. michiganensis]MBW8025436.1 hypothetical protein [Clavibacter michiganensis subsp. michiganensis]MDO4025684.1 hypothetical protein [Clavibacter michiganensis]